MIPTNTPLSNRYNSSSSLQGTTKPNIKLTEQSHIGDVDQNNAEISCIINQPRENNIKYASQQPYRQNINFNGEQYQRAIHMQNEYQRQLMEQYAHMVRSSENMQRNSNMPAQFMYNSIPMYQHNYPPNYYYPSPYMYPQPPPSLMSNPNLYYMPSPYPNPHLNVNQGSYNPSGYFSPDRNSLHSPLGSENGKLNPMEYVFEILNSPKEDQSQFFSNFPEKSNKQQKEDFPSKQKINMKQSIKQSLSSHNSVKTNIQSMPNPSPSICINLIENNQLLDTSKRIKNNYHSLHEQQQSNQNRHINSNGIRNFKKIEQSNFLNTARSQQQNVVMHYLQAPIPNSPQKSLKRIKTQSSIQSRDQNEIKIVAINKNSIDIGVQTILNTLGNYVQNMSSQIKRSQLRSRDYYLNNSIKPLDYIDLPPQYRQQLRDPQIRMVQSTMQSIYPNMARKEEMSKTKKINSSRNNNYNMLRINEENSSMASSNVYSHKQGQKSILSNQQHKKSYANANSISIHSSENKQEYVDESEQYMEESVVQTKDVLKYKDKLIQNSILSQNKSETPLKIESSKKIQLNDKTNNKNNDQEYDAYSETNSIKLQKSPESSQLNNSQFEKLQQKNSIKNSFKYKYKQQQEKQVQNIQKSRSLQTIISVSKLTNLISGFSQLKQLIQFQFPKFSQYVHQSIQELTLYFNKLLMEKEEKIITLQLQKNCLFDRIKFLQENSTVSNKNQQMNNILNSIPSPKSGASRTSPKMQVIIKQPYFKSQGDKNKNLNEIKDEKKQKQQQQYLEDVKIFRQYKLWRQISSVEDLLEGQINKMQQNRQRQFKKVLNKKNSNTKANQEL